MGADSLPENTPNTLEFICPICLPKPKSSEFQWKKASLGICGPSVYTYKTWYEFRKDKICLKQDMKDIIFSAVEAKAAAFQMNAIYWKMNGTLQSTQDIQLQKLWWLA